VTSCCPEPALILCPPDERKYEFPFSSCDNLMADPQVTYSASVARGKCLSVVLLAGDMRYAAMTPSSFLWRIC